MTTVPTQQDLDAIKGRQRATWASGDYAVIGTTLQLVGESLCESLDLPAGSRVLDVAAGNGNASLAAARRGCAVTATDYVETLLDGTRRRAEADGLDIEIQVADAEALPFEDDSFDGVVSTFGVMFVPDPARAAAQLLRVCRPGGRIGLANWTPDGFVGQMFKVVGGYVPPPAGIRSPLEWGVESKLGDLLTGTTLSVTSKAFVFRYRDARQWVDMFRQYYGPTFKAFGALDDAGREGLERDLLALADAHNTATDGTLRIPSEYVEVIATVPS